MKKENINLIATIVGPLIVSGVLFWVSWSFNAKLDLRQAAADKAVSDKLQLEHQYNADTFVKKDWFVQVQSDQNEHLKSLDDKVSQVQIGIATLSGKIDNQKGK